jgi:hypothetical protein
LMESVINNFNDAGYQVIPALISPDLSDVEPTLGMLPALLFN